MTEKAKPKLAPLRTRSTPTAMLLELVLVMAPTFAAVLALTQAFHFVLTAIKANAVLNGTILGVMGYGIVCTLFFMLSLQRERRAAMSWFAGVGQPDVLARWKARHGRTATGQALERLAAMDACVQERVDLVEQESAVLSKTVEDRQEVIGYLVGGTVALGLLGTFIGLLETLAQMSAFVSNMVTGIGDGGNVEAAVRGLVGDLRGPLSSMATAFSASMFGVVGSVLLGMMLVLARRRTQHFGECFRDDALDWARRTGSTSPTMPPLTEDFMREFLGGLMLATKKQSELMHTVLHEMEKASLMLNGVAGGVERLLLWNESNTDKRIELLSGILDRSEQALVLHQAQINHAVEVRNELSVLSNIADATRERVIELGHELGESSEAVRREIPLAGEHVGACLAEVREGLSSDLHQVKESVIHAVLQNVDAYLEAAVATRALPDAVRDLQHAQNHAEAARTQRDERLLSTYAQTIESQQLLRDTLMRLASIQEDSARGELATLVSLVTELRATAGGNTALIQAITERLGDVTGALGRHAQLLEVLRTTADAIRLYASPAGRADAAPQLEAQ